MVVVGVVVAAAAAVVAVVAVDKYKQHFCSLAINNM